MNIIKNLRFLKNYNLNNCFKYLSRENDNKTDKLKELEYRIEELEDILENGRRN